MVIRRPQPAWLAELTPLDPVSGARVTVRVGSAPSAAFLGLAGHVWEPAIAQRPVLAQEYFPDEYGGGIMVGRGEMAVAVNALAEAAAAKRFIWKGAGAKIWRGIAADWSAMKPSFEGLVAAERIDPDTGIAALGLEVDTRDGNLLTDSFAGTGGREGGAEQKGRLKPAGFGTWAVSPPNIPVYLFDEINVVGIIDAYGNCAAISALFENGASYGPPIANYPSYEALVAATLAPGQWATCVAEGMIRLGAPPRNGAVLTCDAQFGHDRTGDLIRHLAVDFAGWPAGKIDVAAFDDLDANWDRRIRWWTESQASVFERMGALADAANAHLVVTLTGILTVARRGSAGAAMTLVRGGGGEPFVTKWQELETPEPWFRMQATAGTVYRKHDLDEVDYENELVDRGDYEAGETYRPGHIVRYSDGNRYLHVGAEPTSGIAPPDPATWDLWETGNADLTALVEEFEKLGADGWLVAVEKQGVIERKADFDEEYDALVARAADLGITAERAAYIAAYDDLETYLAGLGPIAWDDTGGTTAVVRTAWRAAWNTLFEARAVLQDAIENILKATADAKTRNVPRGPYDDGETYEAGDQVVFAGSTYQYINNTPSAGNDPPDGEYWILVAAAGSGPSGDAGPAGITNWLTNGNHTVPTAADGTGGDFSDAGGTYKVMRGASDLAGSATFSVPAKSPNTSWISINSSGVYTVTDPGVDKATATIRAAVGGVNYDITYTLSKNRNGQALRLTATAQAFTFVDGALEPAVQSITLSVVRQNIAAGAVTWTTTPTVTLTGSGDARVLSAAAFGTAKQVKVKAAIGTIEDEIIIVRLDQSTAEAGATVGAPPGTVVGDMPVEQFRLGSDTDLYETFAEYADLAELDRAWNRGGQTQIVFEEDATSPGGRRMVVGDNNAVVSDRTLLRCLRSIPYNAEDLYAIEFEEETINPGGVLYFGVAGFNKDGDNVPGNGSYHYIAATAVAPVAGRRKHVGYFRGYGSPVQSNDPANPSPLNAGVVRVAALAWVNYVASGSVAGRIVIHAARLRKVEDVTTKWRGAWSAGTTYAYGDGVVSAEGHGFASRKSGNLGNQPPTTFTTNAWWTAVVRKGDPGAPGSTGPAGAAALTAELTNDSHTFPASPAGVVSTYAASGTDIHVTEGIAALAYDGVGTANGTWKVTAAGTNITPGAITDQGAFARVGVHSNFLAAADSAIVIYTITGKRADGTAFTLTRAQTFSKSKAGENATVRWLSSGAAVIKRSQAGAYTPASITFSANAVTGDAAPVAYAGRFIIATTTNGTTWTDQYTSAANESARAYTPPAGIVAVRARLYEAGGTSVLLDEEIIPVVVDGPAGGAGSPGRDAVVFHQDATPSSPVVGDTWATVTAPKIWRRWNGTAWVQILGDLAGLSVIADSAYLGTAVILEANIGNLQVGTIKIKDGAITNGISFYNNADIALPATGPIGSTTTSIASVTLTTTGKPVDISTTFSTRNNGGASYALTIWVMRITGGTPTVVRSNWGTYVGDGVNRFWSLSLTDEPAAGTHTYEIWVAYIAATVSGIGSNRFLNAKESKK